MKKMKEKQKCQPRYAFVTGATSGIGEALAYEFAKAGYSLIIIGRREEALTNIQRKISKMYGVKVIGCKVDICNLRAIERLAEWLDKEEIKLSVVVNNAGVGQYGAFSQYPIDKDQLMLETNVMALTHLTKYLLPLMARGGNILQVASTAAFAPGPYMAVYYASKAYVLSFGLALRNELKSQGIGVSVLCPGPTRTPFVALAEMTKTDFAAMWAMTPERVAQEAMRGLLKNRDIIIPGISNRFAASIMRGCPLSLGAALVSTTQKKQ